MKAPSLFRPFSALLKTIPDFVHTEVFSHLFNHALKGQYMRDQLFDIEDKRVAIDIKDSRTTLLFVVQNGLLKRYRRPQGGHGTVHVTIRGSLEGFWLLATRAEDPDTLFFNRQLELEGETETGLYIKNMLDGLDFDPEAHFEAVLGKSLAKQVMRILQACGIDQKLRKKMGIPQPLS